MIAPNNEQRTVLFVEEDKEATVFVKKILERFDFQISSCTTGAEAIEIARTAEINILVVDIILPDMCGEDAVLEIFESCDASNLEVIFFTASIAFSDQDDDNSFDVGGKRCHLICKSSPKTEQIVALQDICDTIKSLT